MCGPDIPVLVVFGPTASGKTALALELFGSGDIPAEIISADSMQVYRGMDIGTAKPDRALLEKLPHHLINIRNPDEQFSAGDFVRLGDGACMDIYERGKLPVILGGTAFYIRNFLYGLPVTPESDPQIRATLIERMKNEGSAVLYRELAARDPESAKRIHIHDEYRIIRALEVFVASGRPLSSFGLSESFRRGYRFLVFSLDRPREELNERIDRRVLEMFDMGLEREVKCLRSAGFGAADPGMQAIGYREFFMEDVVSRGRDAVCAQIQNDSRKYAKRQETFIRPMQCVTHVHADDRDSVRNAVLGFLAGSDLGT